MGPPAPGIERIPHSLFGSGLLFAPRGLYAGLKVPVRTLVVATVVFAAWPVVHVHQILNIPPTVLGVGFIFLLVGYTFWQEGRKQEARADVLLASPLPAGACSVFRPRSDRSCLHAARRSAAADDLAGTFHLRTDGDGGLRRGTAARRAQHAGALQSESGHVELRRRRNSENAGPGAGTRPERGAHPGRALFACSTARQRRRLCDRRRARRFLLHRHSGERISNEYFINLGGAPGRARGFSRSHARRELGSA